MMRWDRWNGRFVAALVTVLCASFYAWMIYFATSQSIGLTADTNAYFRNARLMRPDMVGAFLDPELGNNFPPGYAMVLAAVMGGQDPLAGVRWLHIGAAFALMLLLGHWVWAASRQNVWVMLAIYAAVMANWGLASVFSNALSELVFMVVLYAALVAMVEFEARQQWRWMVLAGIALGAGVMFRYAGLFFVPLFLIYAGYRAWGREQRAAAGAVMAGLMSVALPMAWFARNQWVLGETLNRGGLEDSYAAAKLWQLPTQSLFLPLSEGYPWVAVALNLAGLGLAGWFLWGQMAGGKHPDAPARITTFVLLAGLAYVALLVVNILFFDPTTPINARTLVPARGLLIPAFFLMLGQLLGKAKWGGWALLVLAVVLVGWHAPQLARNLARSAEKGAGYASAVWKKHPVVEVARELEGKMIYTNGRDVLNLLVRDAGVDILPLRLQRISRQPMEDYDVRMDAVCDQVREGTAVILLFDEFARRVYLPDLPQILQHCGALPVEQLEGGVLVGSR